VWATICMEKIRLQQGCKRIDPLLRIDSFVTRANSAANAAETEVIT